MLMRSVKLELPSKISIYKKYRTNKDYILVRFFVSLHSKTDMPFTIIKKSLILQKNNKPLLLENISFILLQNG